MLELWAVDLPELYHLNDVIVFSTRGDRKYLQNKTTIFNRILGPDFNKIAGSDLDGDGYFVSLSILIQWYLFFSSTIEDLLGRRITFEISS